MGRKLRFFMAHHRMSDKNTVICEICGKDTGYNNLRFSRDHLEPVHHMTPQKYYDSFFKTEGEGVCKICYKPSKFIKFSLGYRDYCCVKCAQSDPVVREKVSDLTPEAKSSAVKKRRATTLERYGAENFSSTQVHREVLAKRREEDPDFMTRHIVRSRATSLERYGAENPFASDEIKEKIKTTVKERYGVDNINQSDFRRRQIKQMWAERGSELTNNIRKARSEHIASNAVKGLVGYEYLQASRSFSSTDPAMRVYKMKCPEGHDFEISPTMLRIRKRNNWRVCNVCNPYRTYSGAQNQLEEFIRSIYDGPILGNHRATFQGRMEIDVFLPDKMLGIEFNGIFWHSSENVEPTYHLRKTLACESKGIRLYQVYEDEWNHKRPIVESMLKSLLGKVDRKIHARKCEVREVASDVVLKFLEENHLQGATGSQIRLGLFLGDELVSLMTFGEFRFTDKEVGGYELIRFCSKLNTLVVGAASRLFQHFQRKFKPIKVISYADRDRSVGGVYEKIGFKLTRYSKPRFSYIVDGVRVNRFQFRKSALVAQGFDPSKSEIEIMEERGISRVYNSGNGVYEWLLDK